MADQEQPPPPGYQPPQGPPGYLPPPGPPGYLPPPGYQPPQGPPGYLPPPGYGQPMGYPPGGYGVGPRYAGFWIRVGAYLLDALVVGVGIIVGVVAVVVLAALSPAIAVVALIVLYAAAICYQPYMWWKYGATLGQRAVGVRVVRDYDGGPISGGAAAVRFIGIIVSAWILYLGLIWVAFEPRKRGWHDMMAGTVVVHWN